jgi:hypothetical protein
VNLTQIPLLQFEALQQFDDDERATAQAVLEGLILKHQARQSQLRLQPQKEEGKPLKEKPRSAGLRAISGST